MTATTSYPVPEDVRTTLGTPKPFVILAGTAHPRLAADIAMHVGTPLGACRVERFPDGEVAAEARDGEVRRDHAAAPISSGGADATR